MSSILIVEDEERIASFVDKGLRSSGFATAIAGDGESGLAMATSGRFDLVVLDLGLPDIDGIEVLKRMRGRGMTAPVVILTARDGVHSTVEGLEGGADDYVTKPFRLRELVARVRAALRRGRADESSFEEYGDVIEVGDVRLDAARHEVAVRGENVALPLKEFELLELLLANAGRVLTRDVLIDRVWGPNYYGDTKTLDVHVKRLRAKVEDDPASPARIVTVRGVGYRYEKS
jgi:two-component system, OmpR family, response regulator RegX3